MRFIRSMNTRVDRFALGLAVLSVAVIIISLLTGFEATLWLPFLVGLWVGLFLMSGAFRLFGWRRSTARSIYMWGSVVWVLILAFGPVALERIYALPISASISALPTPAEIAYAAASGFATGAANTAGVIDRRLREEGRRP